MRNSYTQSFFNHEFPADLQFSFELYQKCYTVFKYRKSLKACHVASKTFAHAQTFYLCVALDSLLIGLGLNQSAL